jgi:hypothetical protein
MCIAWKLQVLGQNVIEEFILISRVIRGKTEKEFVEQSAQAVVVDLETVALSNCKRHYLRSI